MSAMFFYSKFDDPEDWRDHLLQAMPGLDFRHFEKLQTAGSQ